jgi:hypothetical protein
LAGVVALLALAAMAYRDSQDVAPRFPMPLLAVVGLAAIALVATGVSQLVSARRIAAGAPAEEPASYRHTIRPFAAIGAFLFIGFVLRGLAVPADFGRDGPYRAGARDDAASARAPRFRGSAACLECHTAENQETARDVHQTVQCETCHGPGAAHIDAPKQSHLAVDRDAAACLVCHRKLTARPGPFPQIEPAEHFKLVGARDGTACTTCHDPHRPIFLATSLAEARLHPLVHRCRDCHVNRTDESLKRPANHPAIFECSYCHSAVAADAANRRHAEVACTTCHLFIRDSDFAGRIVRNDDPRFCLLCHRAGDFRREGAPATIDWAEHRQTYDDTLPDTAPCAGCHADVLHGELQRSTP